MNVTVTNVTGTSATSSSDVYKYYAVPVVTSVTPNSGPTAGGQTVTIKGQWFSAGSKVKFGTIVLAHGSFTVVNARTITATTPAHPAGYVNVTVTTPGGTSAKSAGSKYTFK